MKVWCQFFLAGKGNASIVWFFFYIYWLTFSILKYNRKLPLKKCQLLFVFPCSKKWGFYHGQSCTVAPPVGLLLSWTRANVCPLSTPLPNVRRYEKGDKILDRKKIRSISWESYYIPVANGEIAFPISNRNFICVYANFM